MFDAAKIGANGARIVRWPKRQLYRKSRFATGAFATQRQGKYDVRPAGNAVNLEDEMMKVAANQMDHQAAISLYSRSMGLFRTALGKR